MTFREPHFSKIIYDQNMKQKDILIIVILLFIFTLVSIGSGIYSNSVTSTISESINQDMAPIDPTFDTKTIDKLKSRERTLPSYDIEAVVSPAPITLPKLPPSSTASQGGKLSL